MEHDQITYLSLEGNDSDKDVDFRRIAVDYSVGFYWW